MRETCYEDTAAAAAPLPEGTFLFQEGPGTGQSLAGPCENQRD